MKQLSADAKQIVLRILIVLLLVSNIITAKLYIGSTKIDEDKMYENICDEASRIEYFIKDWYNELAARYGYMSVFRNELQFNSGAYTLTVAADRIRAVYPRGERFFQLDYIRYIEFYEANGDIRCRLYYGETGEIIFKLN